MKVSKKISWILLVFLTLLNITLRYPTTSHEVGVDSFVIHGLANSISANGYAKWVINPLSIFGLYPFSYPCGVPYILSGVSQCIGLNMDWTIFFIAILLGIFGMFNAYIMAREINNDDLFAFLVAFAFSTAPIFLYFTRWTTSTRFLFLASLPLLIWTLLRYHNKKDKRYILLFAILFTLLGTVHRMIWLMILILFAYFVATIIQKTVGKIKVSKEILIFTLAILLLGAVVTLIVIFMGNPLFLILLVFVAYLLNIPLQRLDKNVRPSVIASFVLGLLFVYAFIIPFSRIEFYRGIWYDYETGYFFEGTDFHILVLNMLSNYTGHMGILILFGLIGLIFLLFKPKKEFNDWFILLSILSLVPMLALGTYISLLILPFLSILIALSICKIVNIKRMKKYAFPVIVGSLLISLSFSSFMVCHWEARGIQYGDTSATWVMKDETYSTALFLKEYGHGAFISNNRRIGYRISAFSEVPIFPGHSAWPLTYGFINEVGSVNISDFTTNIDYIFIANNTAENDYNQLLILNCDNDTTKGILSRYSALYYIENKDIQTQNKFFNSIHEKRYKIYDDGVESIWYIQ